MAQQPRSRSPKAWPAPVEAFAKLLAERKAERAPIVEVMKRYPKEIILSAFARMGEQAPFYHR
jgi:hypothetical protein